MTHKQAVYIANHHHGHYCFTLEEYPRGEEISQYEGPTSLWSALTDGVINTDMAKALALKSAEESMQWNARWIAHYNNRLTYEKTLLESQGGSDLLKPKARPKQLPLCNYRAPDGLKIPNIYSREELLHYPQKEMTKAEYADIYKDYRGTEKVDNSHRVRTAYIERGRFCVFLTDSKTHARPGAVEPKPVEPRHTPRPVYTQPEPNKFDLLKNATVDTVTAPQLFPTPPALAARMVDLADMDSGAGYHVLEPSAGTGNLLEAIGPDHEVTAVELNYDLAQRLIKKGYSVKQGDFLKQELGTYERIVMNPPFQNAEDIKHIKHALTLLRPGGRLVAVCAAGPRQNEQLAPLGEWIPLPAGTFKNQGTNVNSALLVINS